MVHQLKTPHASNAWGTGWGTRISHDMQHGQNFVAVGEKKMKDGALCQQSADVGGLKVAIYQHHKNCPNRVVS